MKIKPHLRVLVLTCAAVSTGAAANEQEPPSARALFQQLTAVCPKMVDGILASPDLTATMRLRPFDSATVCTCTIGKMESLSKFSASLNVDEATLVHKLESEKFQTYIFTALLSSVFGCLTTEFEATLAIASPE